MVSTAEALRHEQPWPREFEAGWAHLTEEDHFCSFRHYANQAAKEHALESGIRAHHASTSVTDRGQDIVLFAGQFVTRSDAEDIAILLGSPMLLHDVIADPVRWEIEPRDFGPALTTIVMALPGSLRAGLMTAMLPASLHAQLADKHEADEP
jgi:hypothetical protein